MASAVAANPHMEMLQSMLNLVFLHSGRFLKEEQAGGGTGRMRQQLQRVVPHATERFHDALDELENEVRLAQAVVRRDMALLKQDRKKKEAAAKQREADKARLAAESKTPLAPAPVEEAPVKVETAATPAPPELPDAQAQAQDAPEPASAKQPEAGEVPTNEDHANAQPPPPIETDVEPPRDPLFDGTPTTGNAQESEFDFDAMFGDAMDTTGDNTHDDIMDTSADVHFTLDDGNDGPSLLRGLEDFAKNSGDDNANANANANQASNMDMDFTMPGLPGLDANTKANTDANINPTVSKPAEPEPPPKAEEPKPVAEPPVEEEKEAAPATTNDEIMGTMATDNLEDLFNMDEYENPEQSQFDDAFFNFE